MEDKHPEKKQSSPGKLKTPKSQLISKSRTPAKSTKRITKLEKFDGVPQQFEPILERINDGFVAFDAEMNYTYVNKKGGELLGRKPEDLVGKNYWKEYPETKGTPFANAYIRALKTQEAIIIEDYYAPWDRWFENRIYPSKDGISIFFTEITEKKKAEMALQESEEKFRDAFEAANVGKSITLPTGEVSVNKAFADMLGYSREELAGKTWQELTPPEEVGSIRAMLAPLLNGEKDSVRFNKRYIHKDGSYIWADVSTVMRRGADGKPLYFITTIVNINERIQAEEQLHASEERFSKAFHISPAGITITRIADGKFVNVNDAFCRMFEYSRDEVVGHTSTELNMWMPEERKKLIDEQIRSGGLQNFELQARTKSGRIVTILFSSKPIELEGETHHITTMIDVTARKEAEEALKESQAHFRSLVENASSYALYRNYTDLSEEHLGQVQVVSDSIRDIMGLKDPYNLSSWFENIHPDDIERVTAAQVRSVEELQPFNQVMRIFHPGKEEWRWIHAISYPVHSNTESRTYYNGIIMDITERKRAEEALLRNEQILRLFVEYSPAAIAMFDREMKYIAASKRYGVDYDLGDQNLIGRSHYDVLPEIPERWKEIHRRCLAGAVERAEEDPFPRKSGALDWVRWEIHPWREPNDEIGGIILFSEVITERKQASAKLEEQAQFNKQILQTMLDGFILADTEGQLLNVNPTYCTLVGYTKEELIQRNIRELEIKIPPDEVERRIEQMVSKGFDRFETQHRHKDGHIIDLDVSIVILQAEAGSQVAAIVQDITERKRAEKALRENEKRFRQALVAAKGGAWEWDIATNKAFWSDENYKVLGLDPKIGDTIYQTWFNVIHPDDRAGAEASVTMAVETGSDLDIDFRVIWPDGSVHWINDVGTFVFDQQGNPSRMYGVQLDITERKQTESALRENETLLRTIAENYPNSYVSIIEKDLTIGFTSGQEFKKHNLNPELFIGLTLEQVFGDQAPVVCEHYLKTFAGEEQSFELFINDQYQQYRTVPLAAPDGSIPRILSVVENITERRQAEESLRNSEAHLEEAQRIAHLGSWNWIAETDTPTWSRELCRILEVDLDKPVPSMAEQDKLYTPDSMVRMRMSVEKTLQTGEPYEIELERLREDDSSRWLLARGERWYDEQGNLIGLRGTALDITERKQVEKELRRSRDRLEELSRRLVETHERESRAIGRELHDQIGQMLTAIKINLDIAGQVQPEMATNRIEQSQKIVNELLERVSQLSLELRTPVLDDLGLAPALLWHINRFTDQTDIAVNFQQSGIEDKRFEPEIETTAYRIIQEALTNAARHARATAIRLEVQASSDPSLEHRMEILIEDDGQGFDPETALAQHRGLSSIRERVSLVGGTFHIQSHIGKGTKLIFLLPLTEVPK